MRWGWCDTAQAPRGSSLPLPVSQQFSLLCLTEPGRWLVVDNSLRGTSRRINQRMPCNHPQTQFLYPSYQTQDGPQSTLKNKLGSMRVSQELETFLRLVCSAAVWLSPLSERRPSLASDTPPGQRESTWGRTPRSRPSPADVSLSEQLGPHSPGGQAPRAPGTRSLALLRLACQPNVSDPPAV